MYSGALWKLLSSTVYADGSHQLGGGQHVVLIQVIEDLLRDELRLGALGLLLVEQTLHQRGHPLDVALMYGRHMGPVALGLGLGDLGLGALGTLRALLDLLERLALNRLERSKVLAVLGRAIQAAPLAIVDVVGEPEAVGLMILADRRTHRKGCHVDLLDQPVELRDTLFQAGLLSSGPQIDQRRLEQRKGVTELGVTAWLVHRAVGAGDDRREHAPDRARVVLKTLDRGLDGAERLDQLGRLVHRWDVLNRREVDKAIRGGLCCLGLRASHLSDRLLTRHLPQDMQTLRNILHHRTRPFSSSSTRAPLLDRSCASLTCSKGRPHSRLLQSKG